MQSGNGSQIPSAFNNDELIVYLTNQTVFILDILLNMAFESVKTCEQNLESVNTDFRSTDL